MENYRRNNFEIYEDVNNLITNHPDVKPQLSIQRCYSDGVLTHNQVLSETKVLSASNKSSSESSMNGSPVSTPTKLESQRRRAIEVDCGISSSQSSDDCNNDSCLNGQRRSSMDDELISPTQPHPNNSIVRPKTWKCRITEKKLNGDHTKGRNGDLNLQMNGLEITNGINVHQRGYSQDVCDLYKHETDLFVSRLRGGTRKDLGTNGLPSCLENVIDTVNQRSKSERNRSPQNRSPSNREGSSESNGIVSNGSDTSCNEFNSDIQCLIAPLAVPENLSDEESPLTESSHKETLECLVVGNDVDTCSSVSENDPSIAVGCSAVTMPNCLQGVSRLLARSSSTSQREKRDSSENDTNGADCLESDLALNSNTETKPDNNINHDYAEMNVVSNGIDHENLQPVRASSVSSFDSIDDIGDFIEADLPPNVERLAFFSRGSSTPSSIEEDEGCGDEVLPGNLDDGEDSENETIDPLTSNTCARYPFQNGQNRFPGGTDTAWSRHTSESHNGGVEGVCNILCCDEDDGDTHSCNGCACGGVGTRDKSPSRRLTSNPAHQWNSFASDVKYSGKSSNKGDNTCVCCDKVMDVNFQRKEEIGVNVCDRCFNEHNFDKNGTFENAVRKRPKPTGAFSLNSQFQKRNCNSLHVVKNMQEKMNNSNFVTSRLSSSDSDPMDKLYVSDSSEMVSPEAEAGAEMVFHVNGANNMDGAMCNITDELMMDGVNITDEATGETNNITSRDNVQSEETGLSPLNGGFIVDPDLTIAELQKFPYEGRNSHGDEALCMAPNFPLRREALSLEFNNPDEILYCPYFNRRSRSLEHESLDSIVQNRTPECDVPNIAVATTKSSNFQDDESNNREKLFEKSAYEVHLASDPASSDINNEEHTSSDEEENTRVPVDDVSNVGGVGGEFLPESHAGLILPENMSQAMYPHHSMERYKRHSKGIGLEEEEPIYEDIDDLRLLLEEVCSDGEPDNRLSSAPLCSALSKLRRRRRHRSPVSDVEKVMIWNEYEAYVVQVKQVGNSSCGPTSVMNVLKAFDYPVDKDEVSTTITSNDRMEAAPIPYYLFSRYSAGTTAQALVDGVATVTRGAIKGRFFHFYPPREVELLKWLGYWMKKGAVPVATLNLQRGVKRGWTIPDAWHHQMVYGVSSKGVYLTNPLEIVPESIILEQLMSDSVLLVRRQDVVSRFRDWCPLNEILKQRDPRWRTMNVLGQIVHMLREHCMPQEQLAGMRSQLTSHISVPAAYKAGIILFVKAKSDVYDELQKAPELPLKKDVSASSNSQLPDS